jgi:hypothetical protein
MPIALITDCAFPVPPMRFPLRGAWRNDARVRFGIISNTRYFLELLIGPLKLLFVPDVHLVADVIVLVIVIIDAFDRLAEISRANPAALQHAMGVRPDGPVIDDLECFTRVKVSASGYSYLL